MTGGGTTSSVTRGVRRVRAVARSRSAASSRRRRPRRAARAGDDKAHDVGEGRDGKHDVALAGPQCRPGWRTAPRDFGGVSMTPFGSPVVPLEYEQQRHRVAASTKGAGGLGSAPRRSASRRASPMHDHFPHARRRGSETARAPQAAAASRARGAARSPELGASQLAVRGAQRTTPWTHPPAAASRPARRPAHGGRFGAHSPSAAPGPNASRRQSRGHPVDARPQRRIRDGPDAPSISATVARPAGPLGDEPGQRPLVPRPFVWARPHVDSSFDTCQIYHRVWTHVKLSP